MCFFFVEKDSDNVNLNLRKKRTAQGYLQVFYTPETIGLHEIYILKDGIKAYGSPITIYVFDPNQVRIENLRREGAISQPFSFNINASEAGEGFIRVNVKDAQMNDVLPEITEYGDRTYLVKLIPKINGKLIASNEMKCNFNRAKFRQSSHSFFVMLV